MRVKTVPKTGIIVQAKAQQNASSFGGKSMATSWESVDVGCLFYRESDGEYIRCEGVAGLSVTMRFSNRHRKAVVLERYYNRCWVECPLHKAIAAKYE